jgi:hypothetical protein
MLLHTHTKVSFCSTNVSAPALTSKLVHNIRLSRDRKLILSVSFPNGPRSADHLHTLAAGNALEISQFVVFDTFLISHHP